MLVDATDGSAIATAATHDDYALNTANAVIFSGLAVSPDGSRFYITVRNVYYSSEQDTLFYAGIFALTETDIDGHPVTTRSFPQGNDLFDLS